MKISYLSSGKSLMNRQPKKLLDQVREAIQLKHYSIRTEEAYLAWIKRYILFHNKQPPNEMMGRLVRLPN